MMVWAQKISAWDVVIAVETCYKGKDPDSNAIPESTEQTSTNWDEKLGCLKERLWGRRFFCGQSGADSAELGR